MDLVTGFSLLLLGSVVVCVLYAACGSFNDEDE